MATEKCEKKFKNCIKLAESFMIETNQTIKNLLDENQEIENLMAANYVVKSDFEKDGSLHFIKERLENDKDNLIMNRELFSMFGAKINICMLKDRHYLTLTNYILQLCDLPMMYCCDEKKCLLRNQIKTYNVSIELTNFLFYSPSSHFAKHFMLSRK
jgi:hypothetical protein